MWQNLLRTAVLMSAVAPLLISGLDATWAQDPLDGDAASDRELVKKISSLWQARLESVSSVKYEAKGCVTVKRDAYARDGITFDEDRVHDWHGHWLVDFKNNHFCIEGNSQLMNVSSRAFRPDHVRFVFDGENLRCHMPGVTGNRGTHFSEAQPDFRFHLLDYPVLTTSRAVVLRACGAVFVDARMQDVRSIGVAAKADSLIYHRKAKIDGHACVVLRESVKNEPFREYCVDLSRNGLVLRESYIETGHAVAELLCEQCDLKYKCEPNGWRLASWTWTSFDLVTGKPCRVLRAEVTNFEMNPDADQYQLSPAPGMVVRDDRIGRIYRLTSEGLMQSIDRRPAQTSIEDRIEAFRRARRRGLFGKQPDKHPPED